MRWVTSLITTCFSVQLCLGAVINIPADQLTVQAGINAASGGIESEFAFTTDIQESRPANPGDNCDSPKEVVIDIYGMYYRDTAQTTCGRINDYDYTCLGYYDGGEDIIYEVNITIAFFGDVWVGPGDTYSGFLIDDKCPPDPNTCLYKATAGYSDDWYGIYGIHLDPGIYYIMVDTWPEPNCLSEFDLIIDDLQGEGNCISARIIEIPYELPWVSMNQFTCQRGDKYNETCLGYYDGGEDYIYALNVWEQIDIVIRMDPKSTNRTGMVLDEVCPPDLDDCIAVVTGSDNDPRVIEVTLDSGWYYIMIDTWPSPACIPEFDFYIAGAALCGDADGSQDVDIDDVVYLIAYIFSGGPPPAPIESGDADCSGGVDIDDVVYLIAYIFSGGNAPCDTDGDEAPDC